MKFVRPGIRFSEGTTGVYSDILESDPASSLLVLIDTASYARKGVQLARKAKELGIPIIIVTDRFSHWAREFTDLVLEMNTHCRHLLGFDRQPVGGAEPADPLHCRRIG